MTPSPIPSIDGPQFARLTLVGIRRITLAMCRLYARVGNARTLLEEMVGAPHSLEVQ
ncbi:MAG: hypothetical protein ACI9KE_001767, partial [Polyangiales bacterium]